MAGATYNLHWTWTFTTKNDLSSGEGFAVNAETGDFAADGQAAQGILVIGADSGDTATYAYNGRSNYKAGIAVSSVGTLLSVTASGYMIPADSGYWVVGKHYGSDVASGGTGTGLFNFATPHFIVDCSWLGR